ncbi:uncharacterized protein DNG_05411 [Cephalotrichum gorgonifer]|uniref:Uncharacterized protein n=1 Tax=Cephalotrichum gorgonifer TaxID=2041049 RepID=A0AAE8MXV1_9PEZI|nr:uncharacterized protein DNG_05411 [Cephalotrichum gorgonifer]
MDGSGPRRIEMRGSQLPSSPLASAPTPTQMPIRPPTIRRGTDDLSALSARSDKSDSKSRRSALRRSSSSSKPQSPRRVRFEFAGAEVLPTTSPSNSLQDVRQPLVDGQIYTASVSEMEDDSTKMYSVEAILGLADTEDDEPPPKKVSSSQALRALSKLPLDSDTVWTPVTQEPMPEPDSEEQSRDTVKHTSPLNSETLTAAVQNAGREPSRRVYTEISRAVPVSTPQPSQSRQYDDDDSDDSSDGDFLSIAKPKSFANKKALMSPRSRSPSGDPGSKPIPARRATTDVISKPAIATQDSTSIPAPSEGGATQTNPKDTVPAPLKRTSDEPPDVGPDYSDVFDFEASEGMPEPAPLTPLRDDESDSGVDDSGPQPREPLQMYSTSLAVDITRRQPAQQPTPADEGEDAATPTPAVPVPGSKPLAPVNVGSYKGRPIIMPVVVNPAIHEQAAMMGDFNTFVGGLDGRSGMDDGDMNSFRASLTNAAFSGTPRSFTERLMIEDRLAREEGKSLEPSQ